MKRVLFLLWLLSTLALAQELPAGVAWVRQFEHDMEPRQLVMSAAGLHLVAGDLYCLDPANGRVRWRKAVGSCNTLLVHEGSLVASSYDQTRVVDTASGQVRWQTEGGEVQLQGDNLCVLHERLLTVRRLSDGHPLGAALPANYLLASPETLFVGLTNVTRAYRDGRELWSAPLGGPLNRSGSVLLVSAPRGLVGLDARTGRELWSRPGANEPTMGGSVAVVQVGDFLEGIDLESGRSLWRQPSSYGFKPLTGDLFLIGDRLREARTGRDVGSLKSPGGFVRRGDGWVYLGGDGAAYQADRQGHAQRSWRQLVPPERYGLNPSPGLSWNGLEFLPSRDGLVALGRGPGLLHVEGAPKATLSLEPLQVPGHLAVHVNAEHTRQVTLRAYALERLPKGEDPKLDKLPHGRLVTERTVPFLAGTDRYDDVGLRLDEGGDYLVEIQAGLQRSRALVSVTSLGLVAKYWPGSLLVMARDLKRHVAAAGVDLKLVPPNGPPVTGRTGPDGLTTLRVPPLGEADLTARRGKEAISVRVGAPPTPGYRVYLSTDRPIYRPGNTVNFRGVAMTDQQGQLHVAEQLPVRVEVRDSADNLISKQELKTAEKGSFSGQLQLAGSLPLGNYRLTAFTGETPSSALYFEIQEYRKPPFQVQVKPARKFCVIGEELDFEVKAEYFFGGGVPGAKVHYRVEHQPLYAEPDLPDDDSYELASYHYYRDFLREGEAVTDASGSVHIQCPTDRGGRDDDKDAVYFLTAEVTGAEGREVDGSGSVTVTQGDFGVYVNPMSWVTRQNTPVVLRARTVDRQGLPHSARVSLSFDQEVWNGRSLSYHPAGQLEVTTNAQGLARASWKPAQPGSYRVLARSRDEHGRLVKDSSSFWVAGEGDYAYNYPTLELMPDHHRLKPGQKLRLLVLASKPGPVLLTVEGARLFSRQVLEMKGPAALVEIPIRPEYAPNVFIHASMPQARDIANQEVEIAVPGVGHDLKVQVESDRSDYRPGQTANLRLLTRSARGPVSASVSLGVVDEAVYALREERAPNIHTFFYGHRDNQVHTFYVVPHSSQVAGFQTVEAPTQIRSDFRDTAFWQAHILTDENGRAEVSVPLPDNLTRWRATARGVAAPAEVGQTVTSLTTTLPLMIRTIIPRFAVEGDRFDLLSVTTNRTDQEVTATASLQASAGELAQPAQERQTLAPQASARMTRRLTVPDVTEVKLTSKAESASERDGEAQTLPVIPFGLLRHEYRAGLSTSPQETRLDVPPQARSVQAELRLARSPAALVQDALDYLVGFPYGCVEQTLSRFLPTLAAQRAAEKLGLKAADPGKLKAIADQSLQKLYGYQHSDGGWGWWNYDPTHPYMTGYVIAGLSQAKAAGYAVSEPVLERGLGAARALLAAEKNPETRVYLAWALAMAGQPSQETLSTEGLGTYSQALLAQTLRRSGHPAEAAALTARLRAQATEEDGALYWPAHAQTAHGWQDDPIETTSLVVRTLLEDDPKDPLVPRAIAWLVGQRHGSHWDSTKDTAQVVYALTDYLQPGPLTVPKSTVTLDGQLVTGPALSLSPGQHRLALSADGLLLYSVSLSYFDPLAAETAQAHGLTVLRRWSRTQLKAGERIKVHLTLQASQALSYVMLEDPRAAGTEVVPEPSQGWTQREDRDQKTVFFFTWLPKGKTELEYELRAETPGEYRVLPTWAGLMYHPERIWGSSEALKVTILP